MKRLETLIKVMYESWNYLLSTFRSLGGVAENICQKEGEFGRGIFSVNPNLRSKIYTPSKLMINKEDIYLEGNQLRIKQDKFYSPEIREFFNYYQDTFSWGGGGRENVESFEKGLSLFGPNLRELIKTHMLIDLQERHKEKWDQIILREFLNARAFIFNNLPMICPLLELVNHEVQSLSFINELDGISTPNYPPINGEITHNYNNKSAINRFFYQGFFCKETIVFSFPFIINIENMGINFICKGKEINDDSIQIEQLANTISIEGLPIADSNNPKLVTYYFDEILSRIDNINFPKEVLLKILKFNILVRKQILDESILLDNQVSQIFSQIINYELGLISSYDSCYKNQ